MKLVGAFGVEFPMNKLLEVVDVRHQMLAFPANVVIGADLKIPGVANKGKFKQLIKQLLWQHLFGGDNLRVTREFGADAMTGHRTQAAADQLWVKIGVSPAQRLQCCAYACSAGFGDVHK